MALKKCPYCAGEIQEAAMLCKHCKSNLSAAPQIAPVNQPGQPQIQPLATSTAVPAIPVNAGDRNPPRMQSVQVMRDNSAEKVVIPATIRVSLPLLVLIVVVFVVGVALIAAGILKDKISTSKVNKAGTAQVSLPVIAAQTPNTTTNVVPISEPATVSQTTEPTPHKVTREQAKSMLEKQSEGAEIYPYPEMDIVIGNKRYYYFESVDYIHSAGMFFIDSEEGKRFYNHGTKERPNMIGVNVNPSQMQRWEWTSDRLVTVSDLHMLSREDLELMRNEIYARHGWIFTRPDLQYYFEHQSWYKPAGIASERDTVNNQISANLSAIEQANAAKILNYEKSL